MILAFVLIKILISISSLSLLQLNKRLGGHCSTNRFTPTVITRQTIILPSRDPPPILLIMTQGPKTVPPGKLGRGGGLTEHIHF
jgi:hypothetical protein